MHKTLEKIYTAKWYIIKLMMPRVIIAMAICIIHIQIAFLLVSNKVVFPILLVTEDLTKCTIEVSQEGCLIATTFTFTFVYLQFILPLVNLLILLSVLCTLKIPSTSRGYSRDAKKVMINLLFEAYIYAGIFSFAIIQFFFKFGFNKGNTYDDLALKYTILYTAVIPCTLLIVYINKKRSKKRKLEKIKNSALLQ